MCESHWYALQYSVVLCLVSVRRGSSACIPSVHVSLVAVVVLSVQVECVRTLSCCYICIDWTVVRIDKRGSISTYIIWMRGGLICMGWNVPAVIEGKFEFSLTGL